MTSPPSGPRLSHSRCPCDIEVCLSDLRSLSLPNLLRVVAVPLQSFFFISVFSFNKDCKAPSNAPKLGLNAPFELLVDLDDLVEGGGLLMRFGILEVVVGSNFIPDVEGVVGSFLIFLGRVVGSSLTLSSPLITFFSMFSMGPLAMPSGSSVLLYMVGPAAPVCTHFTN